MQTFIGKVADYLLENHAKSLHEVLVVFPNKRAGLFLKRELVSKISKASWLPGMTTIEQAVTDWSGINLADPLMLRFELMEMHLEMHPDQAGKLVDFSSWAEQFIRDFDEIDHYMVDAEALFNYLSEAKAIELWHPDGSALSQYEQDYLAFYGSLIHYYKKLKAKLVNTNMAYPGMLFRKLAEEGISKYEHNIHASKLVFAGFNALSPAESAIINQLVEAGKATILWDLDHYYMDHKHFPGHEAGMFAMRFLQKFGKGPVQWIENNLLDNKKRIKITSVPGHASQAKAFADSLNSELTEKQHAIQKTAIVLSDESLLAPVINSIPEKAGKFNVTMGLPFQYSPVYQLMQLLLELHIASAKTSGQHKLYIKTLLRLLQHGIWQSCLENEEIGYFNTLTAKLIASGKLFFPFDELLALAEETPDQLDDEVALFLKSWQNNPSIALEAVDGLLRMLATRLQQKADAHGNILLLNHISAAGRLLTRLINLLEGKNHLVDVKALRKLIVQLAPSVSVSLYGEPLEGLQIMGLLETRNLDFETVYLLSANEGTLPGDKSNQSLIPFDIRKQFGLPSHHEKQAVYAYNFFRLMQRASNIHIYYNSEADKLGGGEVSRYILQIKHELIPQNPNISFEERVFTLPLATIPAPTAITVSKNDRVMQLLQNKAEKGFSPTSLANYISCPLRFYLKDLLRIESPDEPDESIGMDVLGNIVHKTLQELYMPYLNNKLNVDILKAIEKEAEKVLQKHIQQEFRQAEASMGKNRLMAEVARSFVFKFLQFERLEVASTDIVVEGLEADLSHTLDFDGMTVKLKGSADRIDRRNGRIHVIDYKTGKVDSKDLAIDEWMDLTNDSKKAKALQLLIYTYLYLKMNPAADATTTEGNIVSLRKLSQGLLKASYPGDGFDPAAAEAVIRSIISSIFDIEQPFVQTTTTDTCRYCDFSAMCQRDEPNSY